MENMKDMESTQYYIVIHIFNSEYTLSTTKGTIEYIASLYNGTVYEITEEQFYMIQAGRNSLKDLIDLINDRRNLNGNHRI